MTHKPFADPRRAELSRIGQASDDRRERRLTRRPQVLGAGQALETAAFHINGGDDPVAAANVRRKLAQ